MGAGDSDSEVARQIRTTERLECRVVEVSESKISRRVNNLAWKDNTLIYRLSAGIDRGLDSLVGSGGKRVNSISTLSLHKSARKKGMFHLQGRPSDTTLCSHIP